MRQRLYDAQIVADKQIADAVARLQIAQQLDHLCLHRHVEGRGRLVEQEEARLQDEGAGERDALALAAGEFMRVAIGAVRIDTDFGEQPFDLSAPFLGVAADAYGPSGPPR